MSNTSTTIWENVDQNFRVTYSSHARKRQRQRNVPNMDSTVKPIKGNFLDALSEFFSGNYPFRKQDPKYLYWYMHKDGHEKYVYVTECVKAGHYKVITCMVVDFAEVLT